MLGECNRISTIINVKSTTEMVYVRFSYQCNQGTCKPAMNYVRKPRSLVHFSVFKFLDFKAMVYQNINATYYT